MRSALLAAALALAAGIAPAAPAEYTLDITHTFVHFEVRWLGVSTLRGRFDRKQGAITLDREARRGSAEITIDLGSVSTGIAPLDAHLKGPDHFDTAAAPTARFVAERFVFDGERVTGLDGRLTLRGNTRPLLLRAERYDCYTNPLFQREVCGGDFEATLQRSAFGMVGGPPGIADEIRLLIQIEAIRQ